MDPYIGEIKVMGFGYPPRGWAQCDGSLLSIQSYTSLFALIGTTYGGDGISTFQLPDFRGRAPVHQGPYNHIGMAYGVESVVLSKDQMPAHDHTVNATGDDATSKGGSTTEVLAKASKPTATDPIKNNFYHNTAESLVPLNTGAVSYQGGSGPHNNMQPSTVLNFCIALTGTFPSRP